jgi:hypothetical protein
MDRLLACLLAPCLLLAAAAGACGHAAPRDWGSSFDLLRARKPPAKRVFDGITITQDEYRQLLLWGEQWFRGETLGNELTNTDVAGLMQAALDVPCAGPAPVGCTVKQSVLPYFAQAIDRLDGVLGNLYDGNGGADGSGYTNDLVIEVPRGTRLLGIEVPERIHTGLDVEAGSAWPIGIVPKRAPETDAHLPYLIDPEMLGVGPVQEPGKLRIGISCALCHYSLDVDWDGKPDLKSAQPGKHTPGSPYEPQESWAVGNQDLHVGWLFALASNPMLGFAVLSGPIGVHDLEASARWVKWVRDNYERAPTAVKKEVVRGMLTQPRGYADISPNALYDNVQYPLLFTHEGWPYNYDGSLVNAGDRNNSVWTTALDFTGLVGLAKDRSARGESLLYWETLNIYDALTAERLADLWVFDSPAVRHDPAKREHLREDILGLDGTPGMLRSDCLTVVDGAPAGMVPERVLEIARAKGLVKKPEAFGQDAKERGAVTALVGVRSRTPPHIMNNAVSLMLDSLVPPRSHAPNVVGSASLWRRGYEVFKRSGCELCHRGPMLTDNSIHRLARDRRGELGLPQSPSTAGWRIEDRGRGPWLDTQPDRMLNSRVLQLYAAPSFDPESGRATSEGSALNGLFGAKRSGYKTTPLRYLWGSAPFLHDGGVGVALRPGGAPAGADLRALLRRPERDKLYGMGAVLADREQHPERHLWPDPALSLQALLVRSERERVIAANRERVIPTPRSDVLVDAFGNKPATHISMRSLGGHGGGHDFYVDDEPGGEQITALVAFLLALDHFPPEQAPTPSPWPAPAP